MHMCTLGLPIILTDGELEREDTQTATSTVDYQFSFSLQVSKVRILVSDGLSLKRELLNNFFSFWVYSQKPRTWNRRSVCRSWRAAQELAVPQMTPRSERLARDPARQASVLSQVSIWPTLSPSPLLNIRFVLLGFLSETQLFLVSSCSPSFGFYKLKELTKTASFSPSFILCVEQSCCWEGC